MSNSKQPPNLDLIQMVQRARMLHDAEAVPSQIAAVYWVEAKADAAQQPSARAGCWVIETTVETVDAQWLAIKAATEQGQLGYKSKVSTASHGGHPDQRLIYVCTADADDAADAARVETALRGLGFVPKQYLRQTR